MITLRENRVGGKSHRPDRREVPYLTKRFRDYATAVSEGRYSAAIGPRNDLAQAGIQVLIRSPRPTEEGGER